MVANSRLQPTIYRCVESLVSTTANANNGIEQNSFSKSVYVSPLSRTGEFLTDSVKTLMQWYLSSRKIWVPTYAFVPALLDTHVLANHGHFFLELFDTQHVLILDCVMVLTGCTIPVTSLTGTVSIAADLGRSATDACIDSTAFAWTRWKRWIHLMGSSCEMYSCTSRVRTRFLMMVGRCGEAVHESWSLWRMSLPAIKRAAEIFCC
ncbi:FAD-binding domain [Alternaria alternata]|nr:FAD-binding domain [Alternaria alternata]